MEEIAYYILMDQRIESIVEFAKDHKDIYSLNDYSVKSVTDMIKSSANEIFDTRTYDSFRHRVDALARKEKCSLSRQTIYRLCYALKIDNVNLANEFLVGYLGENPLSPRVLDEFIIIAGYRLELPWNVVNAFTIDAKETINNIPPSPRILRSGDTANMAKDIEIKVHTLSDLNEYIRSEVTNSYFARTRNTQYMAFFNYMDWEDYDPNQNTEEFILKTWDNESLKTRHLRTFNFENEDEPECTDYSEGDHLTSNDIEVLSGVFPNAFLSYETYRHLMCRDRNEQISTETMLIVLLNDVDPEAGGLGPATDDWRYDIYQSHDYLDFTNKEEFLNTLNFFLENSGCAHLNSNIGFDKLILDAYDDVIDDNRDAIAEGTCNSAEIKSLLFKKLRSVFKKIAVDYK